MYLLLVLQYVILFYNVFFISFISVNQNSFFYSCWEFWKNFLSKTPLIPTRAHSDFCLFFGYKITFVWGDKKSDFQTFMVWPCPVSPIIIFFSPARKISFWSTPSPLFPPTHSPSLIFFFLFSPSFLPSPGGKVFHPNCIWVLSMEL